MRPCSAGCGTLVETQGTRVTCESCRAARLRVRWRTQGTRRRKHYRAGVLTRRETAALLSSRTYCPGCRKRMTDGPGPRQKHVDHVVPLAAGGAHTPDNVRVICRTCNLSRPHDGADLVGVEVPLLAIASGVLPPLGPRPPSAAEIARRAAAERAEALRERARAAWRMRQAGTPWRVIAERLGFASTGAAHNAVFGGDGRRWAPARDEAIA